MNSFRGLLDSGSGGIKEVAGQLSGLEDELRKGQLPPQDEHHRAQQGLLDSPNARWSRPVLRSLRGEKPENPWSDLPASKRPATWRLNSRGPVEDLSSAPRPSPEDPSSA